MSKKALEMEGIVASVDEGLCSGCRICESLCAYGAIEMKGKDGETVAHVIEALCKGCGVCGAACPTKAINLGHFTTEEIHAQVRAIIKEMEAAAA